MNYIPVLILLFSSSLVNSRGVGFGDGNSYSYRGEWDLSAKKMAHLCYIVNNDLPHGVDPPPLPKETYLRNGSCWKYQWNPCKNQEKDRVIGPEKRMPCGYFQMVNAPQVECDL